MRARGTWLLLALSACVAERAPGPNEVTVAGLQTAPSALTPEVPVNPGVSLKPGLGAVSWGPDRLDVFVRASDDTVWQRWFENGTWHWFNMGFKSASPVAATSWGFGRLDLFYKNPTSGRLHHRWFQNGWGDEADIGASTIESTALSAASWGVNHIDVFQRKSSNNELRQITFDGIWPADWSSVPGTAGTVGSAPAAVSWGPNRLDVFWKNVSDSTLQHLWGPGQHPLDPLGGDGLASAPVTASRLNSKLDVFYISSSHSSTLFRHYFDRAWGSEMYDLAGMKEPAVASWGPGRLDLFYQNTANDIIHAVVPGPAVLTNRNDNARTGANTRELDLDVENVNASNGNFGRLFEVTLDGAPWGQPLYVPTLDLRAQGRGIRNVVYVTTASNSVLMFDADTGERLEQKNFGTGVPVPFKDFTTGTGGPPCRYNMLPQVGITSTPVIDLARKTLYMVAVRILTSSPNKEPIPMKCTDEVMSSNFTYRIELHALDMTTLSDKTKVVVSPPTTRGNTFDPRRQLQRPALLIANNKVYLAFGSYTDHPPYTGWVLSYDIISLAPRDVFTTMPNGHFGGIWQSGQGPAADSAGNIYLLTGNNQSGPQTPDAAVPRPAAGEYASAALKLSSALSVLSYFVPFNGAAQNMSDLDLGSGGVMLVPGTNFLLAGGKESTMYLLDRTNLGGFDGVADKVVYQDEATFKDPNDPNCTDNKFSNIHGTPVFWKSPSGPKFYVWGEEDNMRAYSISGSTFVPAGKSPTARGACGMPGGFLSVSANNSVAGTGIVWGTVHEFEDSSIGVTPGRLWAFDGETQAELFSDPINSASEKFAKTVPPTIANGRVYVAAHGPASNLQDAVNNYAGKVIVYGLKHK